MSATVGGGPWLRAAAGRWSPRVPVALAASSARVNCMLWKRCWRPGRPRAAGVTSAGQQARIGEVVRRRFGVDYTLAGLDLLLHRIGWSVQVPARKASERNETQIAAWKDEQGPVLGYG